MTTLNGHNIFYVPQMVNRIQVRFPQSRRRRIRKKWRRRECNWRTTPNMELLIDDATHSIYGHPLAIKQLIRHCDLQNKNWR